MTVPAIFVDPLGLEGILNGLEKVDGFTYLMGTTFDMDFDTPYASVIGKKVLMGARGVSLYALVYYANSRSPRAQLHQVKDMDDYHRAVYRARTYEGQIHMLAIKADVFKIAQEAWSGKVESF